MQIFGLISVLITIGFVAWWATPMGPLQSTENEDGSINESTYQEAIGSAQDLAKKAEERSNSLHVAAGNSVVVYDGISVSENTTTVDLSGRGLFGSLKGEIRHLSKLEVLDLSDNNFTGLPAEVGQLQKLEVLNLANNPFTGLPNELGNLKNLKVLDLRGTQYAKQDLETIKANLPSSVNVYVD